MTSTSPSASASTQAQKAERFAAPQRGPTLPQAASEVQRSGPFTDLDRH